MTPNLKSSNTNTSAAAFVLTLAWLVATGCSGSDTTGSTPSIGGPGGASSTGGAVTTGVGGANAIGGATVATGGAIVTAGGAVAVGGASPLPTTVPAAGGTPSTGGQPSGGTTALASGGTTVTAAGGTKATGGTSAVATGGGKATGGSTATGGTTAATTAAACIPAATGGPSAMNAGQACVSCHSSQSPTFKLGGTLYSAATGGSAVSGATVTITDANGKVTTLVTGSSGNFYTAATIAYPAKVSVSKCPNTVAMSSTISTGDCNSCHNSSMRIHIP